MVQRVSRMITLFRRRLCNSILALHDPEHVCDALGHSIHRCKWCGRYWAIEHRLRTCTELEFQK